MLHHIVWSKHNSCATINIEKVAKLLVKHLFSPVERLLFSALKWRGGFFLLYFLFFFFCLILFFFFFFFFFVKISFPYHNQYNSRQRPGAPVLRPREDCCFPRLSGGEFSHLRSPARSTPPRNARALASLKIDPYQKTINKNKK